MKPYPAYKESGVEWLGPVPEGWDIAPLKTNTYIKARVGWKGLTSEEFQDEAFAYLVTGSDFGRAQIDWSKCYQVDKARYEDDPFIHLEEGDLLITKDGTIGKLAFVRALDKPACLNSGIFVLRPFKAHTTEFLFWVLGSPVFQRFIDLRSYGSTISHLYQNVFEEFRFPIPPLPEQQAIAAFLDRETAKIDGLIEEQRRLIALLAEKRQATISHAVTRGLNPSARLKPSGVDWLGDVPEGWGVVSLRRCTSSVQTGSTPANDLPSSEMEDGFLWYTPGDFGGRIDLGASFRKLSVEAVERGDARVFPAGSVLIVSIGATLGRVGVASSPCSANQQINAAVPSETILSRFLGYSLSVKSEVMRFLSNASTIGIMNQDKTKEIVLALPSKQEQAAIITYLDEQVVKIDVLSEIATTAITLLQERRAALISAAVTGKIDVRDAQASPVQARKPLSVSVLLGGVIIAALGRHASMGRMLVQKHLFMAEAHAGVSELQGRYDRQAAGPYDAALQHQVEADLVAAGLLRVAQDGGPGSRVDYEFLGDAAALRADLALALGDRMARFDDTFHQLADLSKPGIEAVATLYAAWNDFLMDGKSPSRGDLIREVLENWHPEKREKFTRVDLETWLDWMDRRKIRPTGTGPKTQIGRLFP